MLLHRIDYEPKSVGTYTVNVIFADQEIPSSPYTVKVEPNIDVSGVKVLGLEKVRIYALKAQKCIYMLLFWL